MFYLGAFSIGIHKNCKTKHYFFSNFLDMEMTQFCSVNHIRQVCK